jgi:ferredoxin--NADP+ reductase
MNKVVRKDFFSENVVCLEIEAPRIAKSRRAGHFVIVRVDDKGERIPLTISSADKVRGTITLVVQRVGVTSRKLAALKPGDYISDLVGPLGQATEVKPVGTILACGGGVGVAPLLPIVEANKKKGNKVISIIAARNRDLIILEDQIREYSDEVIVMTDDGSYGEKGLITEGMEKVIAREKIDEAIIIGPAIMMKFASEVTRKHGIPSIASLNTIMVDGTGMCGACRVTVDGKTKFVCVDGPEFDAHKVDFDEMMMRLNGYKEFEKQAEERYLNRPE